MINTLRKNKHTINMLIALAVFLNAIAPLSVIAKEFTASNISADEALFGDKILICTPTGFKYISIEELHERQTNGQGDQQSTCLFCQLNAPANLLVELDFTTAFEFAPLGAVKHFYGATPAQKINSFYNTASPRAPPFIL